MRSPLDEAADLSRRSLTRADEIDYATSGDRLGNVMRRAMDRDFRPFQSLRAVVRNRLDELGGVSDEKLPLFMLAADMRTTAQVADELSAAERTELRRLWDDLRSDQEGEFAEAV